VNGLTEYQAEVARLFFSLPASEGFLLAGGGALLATGLTTRPTEDLDFFGDREHVDITAARDQSRRPSASVDGTRCAYKTACRSCGSASPATTK
jgi:hypothetical protein